VTVDTSDRTQAPSDVGRLLLWLTTALLASIPLATTFILWAAPGGENNPSQAVAFGPTDVVLFLLVAVCAADAIERRPDLSGRWPQPVMLLVAAMTWFAIAFLANPSWRGVEWFLRIAGTWAVAYAVHRLSHRRQTVFLMLVVILAVGQAALGITQALTGGAVGLDAVEWNINWQRVSGRTFGRGSFTNPYHLAALLIVAVGAVIVLLHRSQGKHHRRFLQGSLFLMAVAISLTFSRTVFFALLPMVGLLLVRRRGRASALMLMVGMTVGILLGLEGHAAKAEQATDRNRIDSGRIMHLEDAALLVASEPIVGVGPGRYVIALRDFDYAFILAPPHNFVAQAAAETGVPGGLLALAALASFGLWLLRRGTLAVVTGIALVPFYLLDWFPYASPVGLVLSGIWLGVVCATINRPPDPDLPVSEGKDVRHRTLTSEPGTTDLTG